MEMKSPRDILSHNINLHLRLSVFESYSLISNFVYSDHVTRKRLLAIDIEFDFFLESRSFKIDSLIKMNKLFSLLVILDKQTF